MTTATMQPEVHYFLVQTPEACMTFIGGPLRASKPGFVWLTAPDGRPMFEVKAECVTRSTKEEVAKRIIEDRQIAKQANN